MSYIVLARKYRPQTFGDVVGQGHVTQTLSNAINSGRVAHAILFSGPRGTGKTTVARILAKAMNCEHGPTPTPCNTCRSCTDITTGSATDVYEIDGASNNSVDQVRELRENSRYMPGIGRYKIYIIDEVHMLSVAAFNALLKTLEEPPPHVMFMFATTEYHKIPITILSRCQQHELRRIDIEAIVSQLQHISEKEAVALDADSIAMIAREADGSMRDALSLLDQVFACADGPVSHSHLSTVLGIIDRSIVFNLVDAIFNSDMPAILDVIDGVYNRGLDIRKLYTEVITHFRHLLVVKLGKRSEKLVDLPVSDIGVLREQGEAIPEPYLVQVMDLLFKEESTVRYAAQPKLAFEMVFVKLLQTKPALSMDLLIQKLDALKQQLADAPVTTTSLPADPIVEAADPLIEDEHPPKDDEPAPGNSPEMKTPLSENTRPRETESLSSLDTETVWEKLTDAVSERKASVGANLRKCRLKSISEERLEIEVTSSSYLAKSMEKNKPVISQVCKELFPGDIQVVVTADISDESHTVRNVRAATDIKQEMLNHPLIADAIELFNGKVIDIKTK